MTTDVAMRLLGALILEDGRRWGEAAEPWQLADARAVLDLSGPRLHYLTRPRGGSKTTDLAGVGEAALLAQLPRQSRAYAFASDRDQAGLLLDAARGFADRTPEVRGGLSVDGSKIVATRTGAVLTIMASDAASSWGLRPHLVVADELARWGSTPGPRTLWRAIFSALPKVADSRLVVLTSAGDPAHWSHGVLERARGSQRWRVSEVEGPLPWVSGDDLAEQRAGLPDWEYARLHLNRWAASDDRLTDPETLRRCVTHVGPLAPVRGRRYVAGLDLGLRRDRTVLAVCHAEEAEVQVADRVLEATRVVVDRLEVWDPAVRPVSLGEVEEAVVSAHEIYGCEVRADWWQAAGLVQNLRRRGVPTTEVTITAPLAGRIGQTLHVLARDVLLGLPDDAELLDELANVRLRETGPGIVRLDHDPDRHDDRAMAVGLAAVVLAASRRATGRMRSPRHVTFDDPLRAAWSFGDRRGAELPGVAGRR